MAIERTLPRLVAIIDRFSTRGGLEKPVSYGRYDIHPRGGGLVSIKTPQGTILTVGSSDIVHVRESRDSKRLVSSFTASQLPEGFTFVHSLKGDSSLGTEPKPSQ